MSDAAPRLATYEELLALPPDTRGEVLGGQVVVTPAPLPKHSKTQRALGRFIGGPFDDDDGFEGPGGWWIFVEVDIQLSTHDVVRPDLAGWRRQRLPNPGEQRPIEVPPDWICEVLSPSTTARDRVDKSQLYAAQGIPFYWLADPENRTLEAFQLHNGRWMLVGTYREEHSARIAPFEEVELHIGRLFLPRAAL